MVAVALLSLAAAAQPAGAPPLPPAPVWAAPSPVVKPLASGAKAWVLSRPGLPLVHAAVLVNAGSLADPPKQAGLASLTATALEECGTADKTPAQVLEAFDSLGTQLDVAPGDDAVSFSFTVLATRVEPALRQVVDLFARPRFDPAAFASAHQRRVAEITVAMDQPRMIASAALLGALYGDHPRGHLTDGTAASVGALTLDDVKKFHAARYAPANVTFVLVGDLTPEAAQKLLDGIAPKPWATAPAAAAVPEPAPVTPAWLAIDKPGAPQTVLLLGKPAFPAKDPRVPAAELASVVLGGSFTSRLVQNLREKHGYTYGAGSHVDAGRDGGRFLVSTDVKTEVTAEALEQLLLELRGLGTLSPADQRKAAALLDSQLVNDFDSGARTAASYGELVASSLPPDHLSKRSARLAAVTAEQALAAAKDFAPDGYTLIIVGDRARIEKPLAKLFPKQPISWR